MSDLLLACWNRRAALVAALAWCGCGSPQLPPSGVCKRYAQTRVAAMRKNASDGCFELNNVVLVARSSSATAPRLYLQDAEGGDNSAIAAKCSARSQHACTADALATTRALFPGTAVTVQGYYHRGKLSGFEELSVEQVTSDGATLRVPPPITLQLAELQRSARVPSKWFQRATVVMDPAQKLVMYDFSPAELKLAGSCPAWEGFGLIEAVAAAVAPADCSGEENPPGRIAPDAREILVGRQFFHAFRYSSDCRCAAKHNQTLLQPSSFVAGTLSGFLVPEVVTGSKELFQLFEPADAAFPVQ